MSVLIVGIAGGTGSGKTTIANKLAAALPTSSVIKIEHDAYYRDRVDLTFGERSELNFDHPDSLENELLVEHLKTLKSGQGISVPVYDFTRHARAEQTLDIAPCPLVIVEGILAFAIPELRSLFDIKIFVDTDPDIRVFRRIRRDLEQRGRSFQSIRDQYYSTVRPMHIEFVEPSKRWADLIIPEGGDNHVALDLIVAKLSGVAAKNRLMGGRPL